MGNRLYLGPLSQQVGNHLYLKGWRNERRISPKGGWDRGWVLMFHNLTSVLFSSVIAFSIIPFIPFSWAVNGEFMG